MLIKKGPPKVKKELISAIKEKELQLAKLKVHIEKSDVCADIYDRLLIEKSVLKKQLDDIKNNTISNRIKHLIPRREKLVCDYFKR
ncbi:hypothetical protein IJ579_06515 [bacterium]|nr:hypothetical protein [bacterium]